MKNNTGGVFTSKRNKMTKYILYSVYARKTENDKGGPGEPEAAAARGKGVH